MADAERDLYVDYVLDFAIERMQAQERIALSILAEIVVFALHPGMSIQV